jgi:type 1 glutamine amidotransferase
MLLTRIRKYDENIYCRVRAETNIILSMTTNILSKISRRSAITKIKRALGLTAGALTASPAFPSIYDRGEATAFALVGDRHHNIDYIRIALGKTLGKDLGISIDFSDELSLLHSRYLKGYKLLIMLRDGKLWSNGYPDESSNAGYLSSASPTIISDPPLPQRDTTPVPWITAEQGRAVKEFVQAGGSALFYHNTTYISPYNQDFRDVLGAVTEDHPPVRTFKVKITNHDHPITRGVRDFVVTDEQHFVKYERDPKHILMESVNEDGLTWKDLGSSSVAGWAYDLGKGRVCYLAPGHMITSLWNPEYEKIQRNAVKWLLRAL